MPTRRLWLSSADLRERGWQDLFPPPTPTFREVGASPMISKSKTREARKRRPALRRSHLLVAIAMSAMTVRIVESNRLVEFPSGARCMWKNLPHPVQFAIIFLSTGFSASLTTQRTLGYLVP
ncbi:unnamed protein product [Ectocarpus sp. CCAP 1310/34]|nr:unnamed protein product [Ectocarpus sp. CCAP 1310/34]